MEYKTRYRPLEVLGPQGWSLLTDEAIAVSPTAQAALEGELA